MKGLIFLNPFLVPEQSVHQAERLVQEFNKLGVEIEVISDGFSHVSLTSGGANIDLIKPDFAVYLDKDKYFSQILEKTGFRLFNRHASVRVCDDKAETYIALCNKGVRIPKTVFGGLCYSRNLKIKKEWAERIANELSFPIIVKESFGSMGKGVYKADNLQELIAVMESVKLKPHLFQEYIPHKVGVDVRVIVIGGKAIAAMERRNENDFRSNVAQGGSGVKIDLPENFKLVAEKCAQVLGLDYCGVDLLYGENNHPVLCEVNSNAFFDGIEQATGVNVAKTYAEYIINCIKN